jgi:RNA polymerase sigma factor (sigma-70 family)
MDQTSDAELVVDARMGDVDAFTALVERYRHPALRLAYGIAGDEAEDAVQDAFVKAFRRLDSFRPGSAFRPWLFTIVANEARNRRRSMSPRDRRMPRRRNGGNRTARPRRCHPHREPGTTVTDHVIGAGPSLPFLPSL